MMAVVEEKQKGWLYVARDWDALLLLSLSWTTASASDHGISNPAIGYLSFDTHHDIKGLTKAQN